MTSGRSRATASGLPAAKRSVSGCATGASVQGGAHYSSKVFKEALNTPYLSAGSYWLLDARAALASPAGWEIALWGKNLGNEQYVTQATDDGLGMGYRVFNAPRTFGVSVTKSFD